MNPESLFEKIVREHIAPRLHQAGFAESKKNYFFRWEGDCLWRVVCLLRKAPRRDEGWLGLTFCVGFKSLGLFLRGFPGSSKLAQIDRQYPCAMATDIGHLMPRKNHFQWPLLPETNEDVVAGEIISALNDYGLPYFDHFGSLQKALAAWRSGVTYNLGTHADFYIAAVYWLGNEPGKALDFIQERVAHFRKKHAEENLFPDRDRVIEREAFIDWLMKQGD